jgi:hypothetical protein
MSTEERLSRLGLLHLKDNPEALAKALQASADQYAKQVEAWHTQRRSRSAEAAGTLTAPPGLASSDYHWLAPELARIQEDSEPDHDRELQILGGELFDMLASWSIATAIEPRAVDALNVLTAKLRRTIETSDATNGFSAAIVELALRALERP